MTARAPDDFETMVRVLSAGLGLSSPMLAAPASVLAHLAAGEDVKAVKAMRKEAPGGLGLGAAKRMIDELKRMR